ncbi:MAG TPA: NACHT domain-containing protein [Abditibacterium sp.]
MKSLGDVWQIECFDTVRVTRGEHVVQRFRTQKTLALLALLALRGTQSREAVCTLLWPDAEPEAARNSLSAALSSLRRELGEDVLRTDRQTVALEPGTVSTDVADFDAALKRGDWARTVEIYRGPLLPHFHDDPFPALAGEYQEKARSAWMQRLIELEAGNDADALRELARRAILLFGDDERWFLALMRAHRMASDLDVALRTYESLLRYARKEGEVVGETARALAKTLRREKEAAGKAPPSPEVAARGEVAPALNLPVQWTRFFGREAERQMLGDWLCNAQRLVTLTGAGGSGKTRLALETVRGIASDWEPHGRVFFVPLAALSDAGLLFSTIRDALLLTASSDLPPLEQIERALRGQKSLFLLDNFEQLVAQGASLLQQLRERLPLAVFLVTSRVLLNLPGEREFPLSPLPTPLQNTAPESMRGYASAALFCDRSGLTLDEQNAESIGMLCRRLDGIPLALELAAARAKVLSPTQILERLQNHPDFLSSREFGVPARHKTLRAAIEWSADLLSPELRAFFCRLCVFRGAFTLEAAESICTPGVCEEWEALDFLEQLRGHSLLQTLDTESGTRYRLLEMLREWAQSQLDAEAAAHLRARHFEFSLQQAEQTLDFAVLIKNQQELEDDNPNLRAALIYAFEHENPNRVARLVGALCGFWELRSHFAEGCGWVRRALERADELELSVRARLLRGAGILFWYGGDLAQARDTLAFSVELYEGLDDEAGLAHALDMLGKSQMVRSQPEEGRQNGARAVSIARRRGDTARLASALITESWGLTNTQRPLESNECIAEALAIAERIGIARLRAVCLGTQALNFWGAGDHARARAQCQLLLEECDGRTGIYAHSFSRGVIVIVACGINDWELASPILAPVARDFFSIGTRWEFINLFYVAARFALRQGDFERAALIFSAAHARCASSSYQLCGCLTEFELTEDEMKHLRAGEEGNLAWTRGAHLRDEEVVALIEEMCGEGL